MSGAAAAASGWLERLRRPRTQEATVGDRAAWLLIRRAIREQRRLMGAAFLAGIGWTAATVAIPRLIQLALDEGIQGEDGRALLTWTLAITGAALASALFMGGWYILEAQASRTAEMRLRERLFAHMQRLHTAFHEQSSTGQLMSRVNTDLAQTHNFLSLVPSSLMAFVKVLVVVGLLIVADPLLAAISLTALPTLLRIGVVYRRHLYPAAKAVQEELGALADIVEDTVSGMRILKGLGTEKTQTRRLAAVAERVLDRSLVLVKARATFLPFWDLVPSIGLIAVLLYGGHRVIQGTLTIGELAAFNGYLLMLIWPLERIGAILPIMQRSLASAARISEVLATEPAIRQRPDARVLPDGGGEVRFEDVHFTHEADGRQPVLDGLDLVIDAGGSVAFVGPTGSGKSTAAKLLARFYDIDAGRILVDGVDVRDLRIASLRRAVGIVFEETFLFNDTIAANIAFADPGADLGRIEEAAQLAGAHDFIQELPTGYRTVVGERGFSLSGGQRQRIAIARAILANPRVLILDDATSSVDPEKEQEIRSAMAQVMHGRTTIVIAHRAATIALADRVALFDGGQVVADGTHAELLSSSERYRELLALAESQEGAGR